MKKSEAVNKIINILAYYYGDNLHSMAFIANEILEKLEEAGMRPPRDSITLRNEWKNE